MSRSFAYSPTTPKLTFHSLPVVQPDPPGMSTPPVNIPGTVPFRWEEAPGKPKRDHSAPPPPPPLPPRPATRPAAAKSLDPPPNIPSPTTVLDGPYPPPQLALPPCYSFAEGRSGKGRERVLWASRKGRRNGSLGRWEDSMGSSSSSSSRSSSYYNSLYDGGCGFGCGARRGDSEGEEEEEEKKKKSKVTIAKVKRSRSTPALFSQSSSHWLANFYGVFRQVIRRRRDKKV